MSDETPLPDWAQRHERTQYEIHAAQTATINLCIAVARTHPNPSAVESIFMELMEKGAVRALYSPLKDQFGEILDRLTQVILGEIRSGHRDV